MKFRDEWVNDAVIGSSDNWVCNDASGVHQSGSTAAVLCMDRLWHDVKSERRAGDGVTVVPLRAEAVSG